MDLTADGKTVLCRSASVWLGGLIAAVLIGALTIGFAILAADLMFTGAYSLGLVILALLL